MKRRILICILALLTVLSTSHAADAPTGGHYGFLDPKLTPLPSAQNCPQNMTAGRFELLLRDYATVASDSSQELKKLDLTSQITEAIFCAAGTSRYKAFLRQISSDSSENLQAFAELAMRLQNHWQTQYAFGLAMIQQQRMQTVSDYSWKLSLLVSALGFIPKVPQEISNYFYIARQFFPALLPGAVIGGDHYIDRHGMLDGKYPPSPADILTLKLPAENTNYNSYQLWKDVSTATVSAIGSQAAYKLLGTISEAITVGKFSFNPVTVVGSLLIGEELQLFTGMAIDDYEYHKLLSKLFQNRDAVLTAIANRDELQVVARAADLERSAIVLSSFLDTPSVNAWAQYNDTIQTAEHGETWKTWVGTALELSTHLMPEYFFPTSTDQKDKITAARLERDRQISTIQADEDPVSLTDVRLAITLNAMQVDPKNALLLPETEKEQGALVSQGFALSGDRSYAEYIGGLETTQIASLAQDFRRGMTYRNPSHILLEAASFIQSLGDPHLSSVSDDLLNILYSGQLIQD